MSGDKLYLGDGAYAAFDGWSIILTAENGICATDTVCLEPQVSKALVDFIHQKQHIKAKE